MNELDGHLRLRLYDALDIKSGHIFSEFQDHMLKGKRSPINESLKVESGQDTSRRGYPHITNKTDMEQLS